MGTSPPSSTLTGDPMNINQYMNFQALQYGKLATVILPAHNEEEAVAKTLNQVYSQEEELQKLGYGLEVILVLNGCTDATEERARLVTFERTNFRVVEEPQLGYGYAHRRGIAEARGDVLITLDCDATYPTPAIPSMVEQIEKGYGFVTTNRSTDKMTKTSKAGNYILSKLARLFGDAPKDTQSGMWAYKREHIADLLGGVGPGMELSEQTKFILCKQANWKEIDIPYMDRVGDSKLNPLQDGLRCLWHMVRT